ncbi:MAG: D,D-dipeptide ABC transporter permease, partial [Alphaproteobacteria bacterium]
MAFADINTWLTADSPNSRMQARMIRFYRMSGALSRNALAMVGFVIILALILTAIFAPWIATHDPLVQDLTARLKPPSAEYWMGTDELGRDIWSRVVFGARITLAIVVIVA